MWMAGGGFKAGFEYGKTDDYAYNIVENPVHVNDLNATVLRTWVLIMNGSPTNTSVSTSASPVWNIPKLFPNLLA